MYLFWSLVRFVFSSDSAERKWHHHVCDWYSDADWKSWSAQANRKWNVKHNFLIEYTYFCSVFASSSFHSKSYSHCGCQSHRDPLFIGGVDGVVVSFNCSAFYICTFAPLSIPFGAWNRRRMMALQAELMVSISERRWKSELTPFVVRGKLFNDGRDVWIIIISVVCQQWRPFFSSFPFSLNLFNAIHRNR